MSPSFHHTHTHTHTLVSWKSIQKKQETKTPGAVSQEMGDTLDTLGTNQRVLVRGVTSLQGGTCYCICTIKPILDLLKCPKYRGSHISGVRIRGSSLYMYELQTAPSLRHSQWLILNSQKAPLHYRNGHTSE